MGLFPILRLGGGETCVVPGPCPSDQPPPQLSAPAAAPPGSVRLLEQVAKSPGDRGTHHTPSSVILVLKLLTSLCLSLLIRKMGITVIPVYDMLGTIPDSKCMTEE